MTIKNLRRNSDNMISFCCCCKTCSADVHEPSEPQTLCSQTQQKRSPSYLLLVPQLSLTFPFLRLLSADGMFVPDPCSTSASICCYQKVWFLFFFIFIADELSWSSGEELNIHTLPPSRGGEEEEVTGEGSLTPVSNWEIWITLVKLHRYKHPLSWYIFFILCLIFSFQSDSTKSNSNYHFSTFLKFVF